jgi:hypothetical protein
MNGIPVRDDHVLERKLEQCAQRRQRSLLMPRGCPDEQLAVRRSQRVGENEGALLGKPEGSLVAPPSVVQGDEPARKLASRFDPLQFRLGDVVAPEEVWAERARAVAAHEHVDVADVIRLENDDRRRRPRIETLPHVACVGRRRERIENQRLAARLDARRRDRRPPIETRTPVRMLGAPYPETRRYISELHLRS